MVLKRQGQPPGSAGRPPDHTATASPPDRTQPAAPAQPPVSGPAAGLGIAEAAAGLIVTLAYLVVHPVGYVLTAPLWNDEIWVALSTHAPLHQLPLVSASTPLGWTLLLRLVPHIGTVSRLRVVPLAFGMAEVWFGYLIGRRFGRDLAQRIAFGWAVAAIVLLSPFALVRDDLKQYTADAFAAVLTVLLTLRIEERWSRGRPAWLAVLTGPGIVISSLAPVTGAAAFLGLGIVTLCRRQFRRLAELAAWAAAAGLIAAAWFATVIREPKALHQYWAGAGYFPRSLLSFVPHQLQHLERFFNLGTWYLPVLAVAAGVATLAWLRRPVTAVFFPALIAIALAAGKAGVYPLFSLRTNEYLWAACATATGLAIVGAARLASRYWTPAAALVCACCVAAYAVGAAPFAVRHHVPYVNMGAEVRYVEAHKAPGDVILADVSATVDLALYAPVRPHFEKSPNPAIATGWFVTFPGQRQIVEATASTPSAEIMAYRQACQRASQTHGRVWLLRDAPVPHQEWQLLLARSKIILRYRPKDRLRVLNRTIPLILLECSARLP
jgi:hypothetical protein